MEIIQSKQNASIKSARKLLQRKHRKTSYLLEGWHLFEEAKASGADILLPKPAEFVPALIAFLIIFAVVAKFVWPSVLRMLDKRQEKIQGDLDAAAKAREEANKDREIAAAGIDAAKQQADEIGFCC